MTVWWFIRDDVANLNKNLAVLAVRQRPSNAQLAADTFLNNQYQHFWG